MTLILLVGRSPKKTTTGYGFTKNIKCGVSSAIGQLYVRRREIALSRMS